MSDRRIKLICDFNTADCLEVEYRPNCWARVTHNHFRSFTGTRRINNVLYKGPIYYEGTNNRYKKAKDDKMRIVNVEELNTKLRRKQEPVYEVMRSYDRDFKYR
jgi:hypothetical protein